MNDYRSNNYWDNYIRKKFSKKGQLKNLTITDLYKVYDYPISKFWGHTTEGNIVKVTYWEDGENIFIAVAHDETYDGVEDMNVFQLYLKKVDDDVIIDILEKDFLWDIKNYFSFCE